MKTKTKKTLVAQTAEPKSQKRLEKIYKAGLIVAEKKPFLIDLRESSGPFLATREDSVICDAASQIASNGLGFNAGAFFGAAHYLESWTGRTDTPDVVGVTNALTQLLQRKIGSDQFSVHFAASGAESVETALGFCWANRSTKLLKSGAKKVLAFEGSFHGRMMVALASTWNPKKREPFAIPGFESVFVPYPEMDSAEIEFPVTDDWREFWASAASNAKLSATETGSKHITDTFGGSIEKEHLLKSECESLLAAHLELLTGNVFAVIIEPRQCEGGDRYSSSRFHNGLINLAHGHNVPLIYDEVQTGFGLGGEFFWHRIFDLRDAQGETIFPDHVICAKKAQTGLVLSRNPADSFFDNANVNATSLMRGYIHASMMDQYRPRIEELGKLSLDRLLPLAKKYPFVTRPRAKGLSFAFDLDSPERVSRLIKTRFNHGLLFYSAGKQTIRFRLNLSFRDSEIEQFWNQLDAAIGEVAAKPPSDDGTDSADSGKPDGADAAAYRETKSYYQVHEKLIGNKLAGKALDACDIETFVRDQLSDELAGASVHQVDAKNYADFRSRIIAMQSAVYEPARQTSAEEFDELFASENPLAIVVTAGDGEDAEIVTMAFAAPLKTFHDVRGSENDPKRDDPSVAYMVDLTVAENHRGSLGRIMKQAILLLAQQSDVSAIHGRNRDRLAANMWAINLSLGSYQTQHLVDDYPDDEPNRDCIYYRSPTHWTSPPICLSSGVTSPLSSHELNVQFIHDNMPSLVNKTTLSNFVTESYLDHLEEVAEIWPERLRHLYTTSGQSECVDKIVKVLWKHRAPRTRLITIENSMFGCGSFMARSLSNIGEPYFDVVRLDQPTEETEKQFRKDFKAALTDDVLGVFIEPVFQRMMEWVCPHLMEDISEMCSAAKVPWVSNDTAGMFYRFNHDHFAPAAVEGLEPDFFMAYLGGQMGLVGCTKEMFLDDPLLLISTWDGDAFSLAQFHHVMKQVQAAPADHTGMLMKYHYALTGLLEKLGVCTKKIGGGIGWFSGNIPDELASMFRKNEHGNFVSCGSVGEMLRFLEWNESQ